MRASASASALMIGSAATAGTALAADLWSGEHPTHTALLALAVAVVLALRWWKRARAVAALPAASVAIIAGQLLHLGVGTQPPIVDQTVITTFPRTWPFSSNRMASGASSSG